MHSRSICLRVVRTICFSVLVSARHQTPARPRTSPGKRTEATFRPKPAAAVRHGAFHGLEVWAAMNACAISYTTSSYRRSGAEAQVLRLLHLRTMVVIELKGMESPDNRLSWLMTPAA